MRSITATLFLLGGCLFAQGPFKPQISPFFDRVDDGPAFFIQCRNPSGQTLSSGAKVWREAIRIDGAVVPEPFELGPGLTMDVPPGETWRGILALRQSKSSFYPAVKFDAMVRSVREVALGEGKHTIAVQCGGVWSDDITFYWEGQAHP
jgi:hypothetical protein